MLRLPLFLALVLPVAIEAQSPGEPHINVSGSGSSGNQGTSNDGSASISGSIVLPPGWKLSIHTLTIRFSNSGGGSGGSGGMYAFLPVNGMNFNAKLGLKLGTYSITALIDVKDPDGRERQITSEPISVQVQ